MSAPGYIRKSKKSSTSFVEVVLMLNLTGLKPTLVTVNTPEWTSSFHFNRYFCGMHVVLFLTLAMNHTHTQVTWNFDLALQGHTDLLGRKHMQELTLTYWRWRLNQILTRNRSETFNSSWTWLVALFVIGCYHWRWFVCFECASFTSHVLPDTILLIYIGLGLAFYIHQEFRLSGWPSYNRVLVSRGYLLVQMQ